MKHQIKALGALVLALLMAASAIGAYAQDGLADGTYAGEGNGNGGAILVEVAVSGGAIADVSVVAHAETPGICEPAIERIPAAIVLNQSLQIDAVAGATLTSRGILDAVAIAIDRAGGDADAWRARAVDAAVGESEEVTVDVVVAGAGAAGVSAALRAAEEGLRVLLVEKTASLAGASTLAGGLFAGDSRQQKEANAVVPKAWLYEQYMDASEGYMNSALVSKIIGESGATVDWLEDNGCELILVEAGSGGSYVHIGMPATLHGYVEGGTAALTKLASAYEAAGGEVRYETTAKRLIQDAGGDVVGLVARKADGGELTVHARAVVLATGGFGGNAEMLEKYFGPDFTFGQVRSNMGEGVQMAWDAGAAEFGTGVTHYFHLTFEDEYTGALFGALGMDYFAVADFASYPHLRVNQLGERFTNEQNATNYAEHGAQLAMQPGGVEYLILDSSVLAQIAESGRISIEDHYGVWQGNPQRFMEFNEPMDSDELYFYSTLAVDYAPLLDQAVGSGAIFGADTLDALAAEIHVDAQTLAESVALYNEAARGNDDRFFSTGEGLTPVVEGPYYALRFGARNLSTLGGVRINDKIEAVREDGRPIPGLYVAGADAGGMYGKAYVDFEGGTLGFAYTSGRLAGENAASYAK